VYPRKAAFREVTGARVIQQVERGVGNSFRARDALVDLCQSARGVTLCDIDEPIRREAQLPLWSEAGSTYTDVKA